MSSLTDVLKNKKTVVILGHVNPDGDCIGSCLGLYNYLGEHYPGIFVSVYLGILPNKFSYLKGYWDILHEYEPEKTFDLCITLDASDIERLGVFSGYLETAGETFCVDHHITNEGFAGTNVIDSGSSSSCEVLFSLLDEEKISLATAECLYTGMIHDTGVFKYGNTSRKTMEIAGRLIDKGVDFPKIIDDSFYKRTYGQNKITGRAILESVSALDGRCLYSVVTGQMMKLYGVATKELDGIIEQLRIVDGVECAFFLYETGNPCEFKASLRSNSALDVSRVASSFGGGGHVKAAGCTVTGTVYEVLNRLLDAISEQLAEIDNR